MGGWFHYFACCCCFSHCAHESARGCFGGGRDEEEGEGAAAAAPLCAAAAVTAAFAFQLTAPLTAVVARAPSVAFFMPACSRITVRAEKKRRENEQKRECAGATWREARTAKTGRPSNVGRCECSRSQKEKRRHDNRCESKQRR